MARIVIDEVSCGLQLAAARPRVYMQTLLLILVLLSTVLLAGCEMVGDIFQAGIAIGAIMVVLVIVGIAVLVKKVF